MKALSIKQPWAWAIAERHKTIETRTWACRHRGELLICASLKPDKVMLDKMGMVFVGGKFQMISSQMEYGKAIAIAKLVDCRPMKFGDEELAMCSTYPGAIAWILEDIRKIDPFPVRGQLRLYDVEYTDINADSPNPDPRRT